MVTEAFLLAYYCTIATVFSNGWHGWVIHGVKGVLNFWGTLLGMDGWMTGLLSITFSPKALLKGPWRMKVMA